MNTVENLAYLHGSIRKVGNAGGVVLLDVNADQPHVRRRQPGLKLLGQPACYILRGRICPVERLDLVDVEVGEFVLVHVGFAIQKLSREEGLETREIFRQVYAVLEEETPGNTSS